MSELVTVTLKMPSDLRDKLRAAAEQWGQSVSAILIEGAGAMLKAGLPDAPVASIDHGIVRTADLSSARPPAIVSQSRFVGGQVEVALSVPLAVMASTPLVKLDAAERIRFIEDEMSQRFLYRKVARAK